jgi:peptide/nickel transport system ATP-binding protein
MSLLAVDELRTKYETKGQTFYAVDGVSFGMEVGETLGLVGESGCGKSSLGKTILRLINPAQGKIIFGGKDISTLSQRELLPYRRRMQMIFQDPYSSLNPRQTVRTLLETPMKVHGIASAERKKRSREIINRVSLPQTALDSFPHEFSGGQRQRIGIARALVLRPELLICDEPVSALDLSIQAQVLNLLVELKKDLNLSYLFISHDLSVMRYFADRIMVMYLGRIVESADYKTLWETPQHPYTQALLAAIPLAEPMKKRIKNAVVDEIGKISGPGCRFRNRCPLAFDKCAIEDPVLRDIGHGHKAACHRLQH